MPNISASLRSCLLQLPTSPPPPPRTSPPLPPGATGYLGSLVLEQLLRVCGADVGPVFLLARGRRGKGPRERVARLLGSGLFGAVRRSCPDALAKVRGPGVRRMGAYGLLGGEGTRDLHISTSWHQMDISARVRPDCRLALLLPMGKEPHALRVIGSPRVAYVQVVVLEGDLALPELGLSPAAQQQVADSVSVVIHSAAR